MMILYLELFQYASLFFVKSHFFPRSNDCRDGEAAWNRRFIFYTKNRKFPNFAISEHFLLYKLGRVWYNIDLMNKIEHDAASVTENGVDLNAGQPEAKQVTNKKNNWYAEWIDDESCRDIDCIYNAIRYIEEINEMAARGVDTEDEEIRDALYMAIMDYTKGAKDWNHEILKEKLGLGFMSVHTDGDWKFQVSEVNPKYIRYVYDKLCEQGRAKNAPTVYTREENSESYKDDDGYIIIKYEVIKSLK